MKNLYARLHELLGKEMSSPEIKRFSAEVGEFPEEITADTSDILLFPVSRCTVFAEKSVCKGAIIVIENALGSGLIDLSDSDLPKAVNWLDSRGEIEKKMSNVKRTSSGRKPTLDCYNLGNVKLTMSFRDVNAGPYSVMIESIR